MKTLPAPVVSLTLLALSGLSLGAQELPARQSFEISSTFAPDSSHILIGEAEQRRVWTAAVGYGRTIWGTSLLRVDYEGSFTPFFQERDPTTQGMIGTLPNGFTYSFPTAAARVIQVNHNRVSYLVGAGPVAIPLYPETYSSEKTYAISASPLGARINVRNSKPIQPTFALDLGFVVSARDIPIDDSASFNYLFSFGPGVEIFYRKNAAMRFEYLYRHMSNANSGLNNPGVDAGVFRLSLSRRRR